MKQNFNQNIALLCGVHAAIIAQYIWQNLNENTDTVFSYNGLKWMCCSQRMFTGQLDNILFLCKFCFRFGGLPHNSVAWDCPFLYFIAVTFINKNRADSL